MSNADKDVGSQIVNRTEYQRTLFETAMLVMVCDGDICDREIEEMRAAFKNSVLFQDLTFEEELARVMEELNQDKKGMVLNYFARIETEDLSSVQKLQMLEVALRIVYADDRVDLNEIRFVTLLKSRLQVLDEIFFRRFGDVEFLSGNHTLEKQSESARAFIDSIKLPDFGELVEISK